MKSYPPGHEILFYAPATNLVGSQINHVCEFLWKFDDGEFKEGAVVSKIWNTLGIHKATCIVKNKESGLESSADISVFIDTPFDFELYWSAEYVQKPEACNVGIESMPGSLGLVLAVEMVWNG